MFLSFLPLLLSVAAAAAVIDEREDGTGTARSYVTGSDICSQIADSISGGVYYPLSLSSNYQDGIKHYFTSSAQNAACVAEVASLDDLSTVIKFVGTNRMPWAVKSGGHSGNADASSTTGVQISLARMKQVILSPDKMTVEVGLGNTWPDVYAALNGTGVNVVGGRVAGPGTGGFTLGGGYSWLTSQHGLTCDNVNYYNLVLPNGTITKVDSTIPDLNFALKGGLNRFGVVGSIVYNTVPQPDLVYGGTRTYTTDKFSALTTATANFQKNNDDPKAQVILTFNTGFIGEFVSAILFIFYDEPTNSPAFAEFDAITAEFDQVKVQTFADFVKSVPSSITGGSRGAFHTMSTYGLTEGFIAATANESLYYAANTFGHGNLLLSYDIEPFGKYGQYAKDSAYPHAKGQLPMSLFFTWPSSSDDAFWRRIMQTSINHLIQVAKDEGIYGEDNYAYPNYSPATYTGAQLYGPTNAAKLRSIAAKYDPEGVMSLSGGFTL